MSFKEKIEAIRNIELSLLKKESMIGLFFWFSWILAPYMVTEKILFVKFKIHKKNRVYESNLDLVIWRIFYFALTFSYLFEIWIWTSVITANHIVIDIGFTDSF